jgi:hypothetical protein
MRFRNVDPVEAGVGLLIAGVIVVIVLAAVSDGGGGGGAKTVDPGELRACLDRKLATQSDLFGFRGEPSEAQTSFALTSSKNAVDVFVMQDSGAAKDAASHASTAENQTARVSSSENVMWLSLGGGSETQDNRIRNCVGEVFLGWHFPRQVSRQRRR